jgi:hypothetical protein
VKSRTAVPIGVGVLIAGGNYDEVLRNHIYDNWRRGAMLVAVPDAIACAPNPDAGAPPCQPKTASQTSNQNHFYDNIMGRDPGGQAMPNGVDFWWDEFPSNGGNCFGPNNGTDGTEASITTDPPRAPGDATAPGFMPMKDCRSVLNSGKGNSAKEAVLLACAGEVNGRSNEDNACDWFIPPAKPGTAKAQAQSRQRATIEAQLAESGFPQLPRMCTLIGGTGGTLTCSPFAHRLGG